jgi:hypothetical protein
MSKTTTGVMAAIIGLVAATLVMSVVATPVAFGAKHFEKCVNGKPRGNPHDPNEAHGDPHDPHGSGGNPHDACRIPGS